MRSSKSRSRNKSNRQRSLVNIVNRVFDSSGPEGKVRGTPQQIIEKYLTLARDAQLSNDRVAEQSFLQHAEHYTRMLGEAQKEMAERQQFTQPRQDGDDARDGQSLPVGNNGYPNRDGGGRDDTGRDNNGRDNTRRETGSREQPRDHGGREHAPREHAPRDHAPREHAPRDHVLREQPRPESVPNPQAQPSRPDPVAETELLSEGLPDAVTMSEDEATGPIETPESTVKPARSRTPRAPRGDKPAASSSPAGRNRRKPAEDATPPIDPPGTHED